MVSGYRYECGARVVRRLHSTGGYFATTGPADASFEVLQVICKCGPKFVLTKL